MRASFFLIIVVGALSACYDVPTIAEPPVHLKINGDWVASYAYHVDSKTDVTQQFAGFQMSVNDYESEIQLADGSKWEIYDNWINSGGTMKANFVKGSIISEFSVEIPNADISGNVSLTIFLKKPWNGFDYLPKASAKGTFVILLLRSHG